ncbi:MAG: C25 family cysteine peptidase [Ardenticatenaceae bacterium]
MRKILLSLFSLIFLVTASVISLVAATSQSPTTTRPTSLQVSLLSEPVKLKESVRDEGTFTTFESTLPLAGETGMPALPLVTKLVAIPATSAPQVSVGLPKAKELATPNPSTLRQAQGIASSGLRHPLEPVATYYPVIDPPSPHQLEDYAPIASQLEAQYLIDQTRYRDNGWYPEELVQVSEPMTLRGQTMVRVEFTPVQVNLATGDIRWFSSADVTLAWESEALTRSVATSSDPHFESTFAGILSNYEEARDWRTPREPASTTLRRFCRTQACGEGQSSWMIMLEGQGLFKIPLSDLESAGVDVSNPERLAVFYGSGSEEQEQALWLDGQNLYLLNTRDHGRWSKKIVYRLERLTSGAGLRMQELPSPPTAVTSTTQVAYELRFEENKEYLARESSTRRNERWLWNRFFVHPAVAPSEVFTVSFDLPNLAPQSDAVVTSELGPGHFVVSGRCYQAEVSVNNQSEQKTWYEEHEGFEKVIDVPANDLSASGNIYRIEQQMCGSSSLLEFNAFTVNYERLLVAEDDELWFSNEGTSDLNYELSGFTSSNIVRFEITSPSTPRRITGGTPTGNGPFSFAFGRPATPDERYLVTTLEQAKSVDAITRYEDQGLRSDLSQTDYLIISHPDFIDALQPLVQHRQAEGLSTRLVSTVDIYNDFGFGTLDPDAIREFIKYSYQNWEAPALSYVLLVGDGTYDPLDFLGTGQQVWVPPMLVYEDPYLGEVPSDNAFVAGLDAGDPSGDHLADVHIGRLPAKSAEQASAMAQKIVRYESQNRFYDWRRNILFTTDDPDSAGNFYQFSDKLTGDVEGGLDLIPQRMNIEKAYLRHPDAPYPNEVAVRDKIVESLNDGALIVQYIGHSGRTQWAANGGVWSQGRQDLNLLHPNERLPLSLPWACWEGYFVGPDKEAISEEMMRLPDRGVIASFSPVGLDVATGHDFMTVEFYRALFAADNATTELGELTHRAKQGLSSGYRRMWFTYMLYGDPAMNLNVDPCVYDENIACVEETHLYLPILWR